MKAAPPQKDLFLWMNDARPGVAEKEGEEKLFLPEKALDSEDAKSPTMSEPTPTAAAKEEFMVKAKSTERSPTQLLEKKAVAEGKMEEKKGA